MKHRVILVKTHSGFTLIELLVALTVMAVMAVLGWRGLEGMMRVKTQTSQQSDEVLTLQAGLSQWKIDLDMIVQTPGMSSLDWDGRVLRMTRQALPVSDGLVVTAWTRRADKGGQWLRWQSSATRSSADLRKAWEDATAWAQIDSQERSKSEVFIAPLQEWQIIYYRGDAWTNPLSSDGAPSTLPTLTLTPTSPPTSTSTLTQTPTNLNSPNAAQTVPEGIRLILTLPSNQAISGKLVVDWVRPNLVGDK